MREVRDLLQRRIETRYPYRQFTCYEKFLEFRDNKECGRCHGRGSSYDGQPDPIEGYKLVPRKTCEICKGSGQATVPEIRERYKKYLLIQKKEERRYIKKAEHARNALDKLKDSELNALYDLATGYL